MRKALLLISLFYASCLYAQSQDWAVDIAPIIYKNCTQCHHSGGLAPFSLMTYTDAFAVKLDIQDATNNLRMPPWPPNTTYNHFAHERILKPAEITAINDWVNNGAVSGNLSLAPTPPVYSNGSLLGTPDLSIQIPSYSVGSTSDIYRCFVIPSGLVDTNFIKAMEVIPGNPAIVHHVLIYADDANTCITLDSLDPGPGYTNFGGPGSNSAKLIGAWVPGTLPYTLPVGMGISLNPNTNIIIQIHYPAGSFQMVDTTKVNFILASGPMREVLILPILNHSTSLVNGPLFIPADSIRTFHEEYTLPILNVSMLAIAPHMHLIARDIISYGVTPVNDTIPLIKIDNWNFQWQGSYSFPKVLKIPGGTKLHAFAKYDNTSANPLNPNIPPKNVALGESTKDEMMLVYFFFLLYQPGDENIIQDSNAVAGVFDPDLGGQIVTPQLYDVYPNPGQDHVNFTFYMPKQDKVTIQLTDISGRIIDVVKEKQNFPAGMNDLGYNVSNLAKGNYLVHFTSGKYSRTKNFIKE